jgi:hypothetical protein
MQYKIFVEASIRHLHVSHMTFSAILHYQNPKEAISILTVAYFLTGLEEMCKYFRMFVARWQGVQYGSDHIDLIRKV